MSCVNSGESFSFKEMKGMSFLTQGKINRDKQNEGQINKISNNIKNSAEIPLTSLAANIQMRYGGIYNEGQIPKIKQYV